MTKRRERCDGKATREAILEAAAEEFAARGYELASMREICRRAGANSALASRYFESKEGLYRTVAKRLFGDLGAPMVKLAATVMDDESWRKAIRTWVNDFLYMTIPTAKAQKLCAGLFKQEVTNPTKFHSEFSKDFGKSVYDSLRELIVMKEKDETRVELITSSVWAEVSAYALADKKWHKVFRPKDVRIEEWREKVGEFICANLWNQLKEEG